MCPLRSELERYICDSPIAIFLQFTFLITTLSPTYTLRCPTNKACLKNHWWRWESTRIGPMLHFEPVPICQCGWRPTKLYSHSAHSGIDGDVSFQAGVPRICYWYSSEESSVSYAQLLWFALAGAFRDLRGHHFCATARYTTPIRVPLLTSQCSPWLHPAFSSPTNDKPAIVFNKAVTKKEPHLYPLFNHLANQDQILCDR